MRDKLKAIKPHPSSLGWIFFLGGIVVHVISALLRVYFTSGFSLLITIPGLVLIFLGKQWLKKLSFAISFIFFMIPLPMLTIANLSFRLKILAAKISTILVNSMGIAAIREGSIIRTMHSNLVVEDPCSGIRSLIALIALGSLMAYFSNLSKPKKAILFLSSVPIAVCTNVIRIVILGLVSEIYGAKAATGLFHDTMGLVVFILAFFGLSMVAKLLE
jgi:exosortase